MKRDINNRAMNFKKRMTGFTLIELIIAVSIVGIISAIAYPSYINSITHTKRRAAEACLSNFAMYMERFYTTNLRYDMDSSGTTAVNLPVLDCSTDQNSGRDYEFSLAAAAQSTYMLQAVPQSPQSTRDAKCGTLKLDQTGKRYATGSDGADKCW